MKVTIASLLLLLMCTPTTAANVSAVITGTSFEGGPAFLIEAGVYSVGAGIVRPNVDTPRLYSFDLPDEVLSRVDEITIRFLNDLYEEGAGDRNLYVLSVSVDGLAFTDEALRVVTRSGADAPPGILTSSTSYIAIRQPIGGWFAD